MLKFTKKKRKNQMSILLIFIMALFTTVLSFGGPLSVVHSATTKVNDNDTNVSYSGAWSVDT